MDNTKLTSSLLLVSTLLLSACSSLPLVSKGQDGAQSNENQASVSNAVVAEATTPTGAELPSGLSPAELHDAHMLKIYSINQFQLQTRMAVQTEQRSFSGATRWQHQEDADDISVLSPLGGQVASIKTSVEGVELKTSEGKTFNAKDVETLTEETLGWRLPLSGLSYWVLGRPTKKLAESMEWDLQGRVTKIFQDGWKIEYSQYVLVGEYWLPKKILLLSPNLNLKLVVQEWSDVKAKVPEVVPTLPVVESKAE